MLHYFALFLSRLTAGSARPANALRNCLQESGPEMMCRRNAIQALMALAAGGTAQTQPTGPYCWTGKRLSGDDAYAPCRDLGLTTGSTMRWISLDLVGIAGIRVRTEGEVHDITVAEIFNALKNCDCLEPGATP